MKLERMARERRFSTTSTMVIRAKAMQSLYASSNPSACLSTPENKLMEDLHKK
jgi:hypothetical protein